jgi:hypothetical protein
MDHRLLSLDREDRTTPSRRLTMDYFLSGHGSSDTLETFTLPCDLVVYTPFGSGLDIPTSWRVFDALAAGNMQQAGHLEHSRHAKGTVVAAMTLYPTTDFTSGIFTVGSGKIPQRSLDGGQFTLKDFCRLYRDAGTVHWVACL